MEVSLILRVLPRYIGCHYYIPFLLSEDWFSQLHFHFPKVGIATNLLLLLYGLSQLPKLLIYISMDWHNHPTVV